MYSEFVQTRENALKLYNSGSFLKAREMCESLCKESPEDPEVWCLLCVINGSMGFFDEALRCGRKAISMNPDHTLARFNLANALLRLDMIDDAVIEFTEVLNRQPAHGLAYYLLGTCYNNQSGKVWEALDCHESALALMGDPPDDLLAALAELYETTGQGSRARTLANTLLQKNPDYHRAELVLVLLDKAEGQLEAAHARLCKLLKKNVSPVDKLRTLGLLAHILDRRGDYKGAYNTFEKTGALSAELAKGNYNPGFWYDRIHRNRAVCCPENVLKWRESDPEDSLPDPVFLVGFPRSGTTLTERIVSTHPGVVSSDEYGLIHKLIFRLSKIKGGSMRGAGYPYMLNELSKRHVAALRQEYWNLAQDHCGAKPHEKMFLDKLPFNIIELALINCLFPKAKILVLLRDPRDVCLSCFMQLFRLNDAMANFIDIGGSARFYDATMSLWLHYEKVLELNLFKLRYEDLIADIDLHARKILQFLGLPWDDSVLDYYKDNSHGISTPSYQDTARPIYTRAVGRWKNYREQMGKVLPILDPYLDTFGYNSD